MPPISRSRLRLPALAALVLTAGTLAAAQPGAPPVPASADTQVIVHVLNRIGFGPGPGDVDRVRRMGLPAYIERQLHPERIPDDALGGRLSGLPTVAMTSRQLAEEYFIPAMAQRREAQRAGMTADGSSNPERRVLLELTRHKILRAVYSERQLEEVLVDFWFNHFNVFAGKGPTRIYVAEYERDTIRPRVLGTFRELLGAVAQSPAMLFYLDNWQSAAPNGAMKRPFRGAAPNGAPPQRPQRGLNENYARELMELHTLGVDGGYTQKDVQEVARAFTGWTIDAPRQGGGFRFNPRLHDDGEKAVLGTKIPAGGGMKDGERVLDMLASHPSTARFVATKLARRFVADAPPKALVDRAAARFLATGGNIRAVLQTILSSPEFFAPAARRSKVKTPLEFVASAVRAAGVEVGDAQRLAVALRQLGMPAYLCQPPTGYGDTADRWVNTGALLNRMNFAVSLTGKDAGPPVPVTTERLVSEVLAGDVSRNTLATVARASNERQAVALLLGSPEFQKR